MVTIVIYQLLISSALYEHVCLENINKLYKYAGKYDDQQQYKSIIETAMVSSIEVFIDNSPMPPRPSVTVKKPSTIKPLRKFTEAFDVKNKTAV